VLKVDLTTPKAANSPRSLDPTLEPETWGEPRQCLASNSCSHLPNANPHLLFCHAGGRTHSVQRLSKPWEPIQCPLGFSAFDAIGRAEAHSNLDDCPELEAYPSHASPVGMPTPAQPPKVGPPCPNPSKALTKNQKKNLKDCKACRAQRALSVGGIKGCSKKHWGLAARHPLGIDTDITSNLPHSKPAWVGLHELESEQKVYGLQELQEGHGLQLIEWDGRWALMFLLQLTDQPPAEPPT
jgi:hypothetical protein